MQLVIYRIISIIIGYLFGLIQTAYIYGRMNNIDIRDYGSGNAGTTNAMRVLGKKAGIITYFGDTIKAILAGTTTRIIFGQFLMVDKDFLFVLIMCTGIGVILGHNFPFYMGFKGGKGIAASSGVIVSTGNIYLIIPAFLTFIFIAKITKYVSLASIIMMTGFFVETIVYGEFGLLNVTTASYKLEVYIIAFAMSFLAIFKHRENIKRLINKTERKLGEKKTA